MSLPAPPASREPHRPDRRAALLGAGALALAPFAARAASKLGEDGLYHTDWFLESFLDIAEDVETAHAKGKNYAVLWGLKGCPACKRMHEVHLEDSGIVDFLKSRFEIVHLNILGAKEVTDFDGTKLGEKAFSQRYAIRTTPTIQFFPRTVAGLKEKAPVAREIARMPGLLEPKAFLAFFRYVDTGAWQGKPFADWYRENDA